VGDVPSISTITPFPFGAPTRRGGSLESGRMSPIRSLITGAARFSGLPLCISVHEFLGERNEALNLPT
jgi:hypothetical protein